MGILEIVLIIAVALKMAGVAFATTSYLSIVGYYFVTVLVVFAIVVAFLMATDGVVRGRK